MNRRGSIKAILAIGVAPAIAHARAVVQTCTLPPSVPALKPVYDLVHPPWLPPGKRLATRRVWAAAVAEYLAAVGAAVGLDPARQRITTLVDDQWISAQAKRILNTVRLTHPLLEVSVYTYRSARAPHVRVGLGYRPGPNSPLSLRRPDSVTYFGVFRDATTPSDRRLIDRMSWLAGLEDHPFNRRLTDPRRA